MPQLTEPNTVGKRERLADMLTYIGKGMTPFLTRVKKVKGSPNNMLFSWLVDNYATPDTGAIVDGQDVASFENPAVNRARIYNYCHNKQRTAMVSTLAEEMTTVPTISSEIANAARKKLIELSQDIESVLLGDQDGQADDGSSNGYKTCGLDLYISTAGPTTNAVPAAFRPSSAQVITTATASLTEQTDVQGILKAIFDANRSSGDYVAFCGSTLRARFTSMTRYDTTGTTNTANRVRTFTQSGAETSVSATTAVYHGDYGDITIVTTPFIGMSSGTPDIDRGYIVDMDSVGMYYPMLPFTQQIPDLGGGPRLKIQAVFGLMVNDGGIKHGKFKP